MPRILALHCDPRIEVGKIGTRIGAITSASDTIKIELSGRGGHTSRPHLTEELVFALAQIAVNVPAVLSRRVDVRSGVSVVWGADLRRARHRTPSPAAATWPAPCAAWTARPGTTPASCSTRSSARSPSPYGVDVHLEHTRGVPPVVNSEHETALIEAAARAEIGEGAVVLTPQSMGGEDFAWFLADTPGAMMRLGTKTPGGEEYDLHRGDYVPDEQAIGVGVRVMARRRPWLRGATGCRAGATQK